MAQSSIQAKAAANQGDRRRLRAYELWSAGWQQCDIAAILGVSEATVSRWMACARAGGKAALRKRTPPGVISRLSPEQKAYLPSLLENAPAAFGIAGRQWTYARVAAAINIQWQVSYDPAYVARLLKANGWTPQKRQPSPSEQSQ